MISIIIPVFNRAELVKETLDSIIAQTYTDWECLCVDDQSTDNSYEVLREYAVRDSRIKVFRRPDDRIKGGCTCRNIGYENSTGEIVYWFDSDDILSPEAFEVFIKTFEKNPDAEWLYTEPDHFTDKYLSSPFIDNKKTPCTGVPLEHIYTFRLSPTTQRLVWKRELLQKCGVKWTEGLSIAQDTDFIFRVLVVIDNKGAFVCGTPLVHWRNHKNNVRRMKKNKEQKAIDLINVRINTYRLLSEHNKFTSESQNSYLKEVVKKSLISAVRFGSMTAGYNCYKWIRSESSDIKLIISARLIWICTPLLHSINMIVRF